MSKHIFIDGGAHNGCSVKRFRATFKNCEKYEIFSFECNPYFFNKLEKLKDVTIIKKAIWIKNDIIKFYQATTGKLAGSSVYKDKKTGNLKKKHINVESIDFSNWILSNFKKDDYIILKLDIEGAEYKVLEKMIQDRSIEYIDKLFVEWHWNKINYSKEKHLELVNKLGRFELCEWQAIPTSKHPLGYIRNGYNIKRT